MKLFGRTTVVHVLILSACFFICVEAHGQAIGGCAPTSALNTTVRPPAPCVLPPVWPSTSAFTADAPIASNPLNPRQLVLGSVDQSCNNPGLGFYMSSDGGSTWQHSCLPEFSYKGNDYFAAGNPMVAFDWSGAVYQGGYCQIDNDYSSAALVALRKSIDGGKTWSYPTPVMGHADSVAPYTWLTVDNNQSSPYLDSVYVSGVLIGPSNSNLGSNYYNQVVVSHSSDGGQTWKQVAVGPEQHPPFQDQLTTVAVGRNGTVFATWILCSTQSQACAFGRGDVLFSKSSDGGKILGPNRPWLPPLTRPTRSLTPAT